MSRETIVFIAGIATVVVPHLGVPDRWKLVTLTVVGAVLIWLGYSLRRSAFLRKIDRGNGERAADSFVENTQNLFEQEAR